MEGWLTFQVVMADGRKACSWRPGKEGRLTKWTGQPYWRVSAGPAWRQPVRFMRRGGIDEGRNGRLPCQVVEGD